MYIITYAKINRISIFRRYWFCLYQRMESIMQSTWRRLCCMYRVVVVVAVAAVVVVASKSQMPFSRPPFIHSHSKPNKNALRAKSPLQYQTYLPDFLTRAGAPTPPPPPPREIRTIQQPARFLAHNGRQHGGHANGHEREFGKKGTN